jgi:hypothetical protein
MSQKTNMRRKTNMSLDNTSQPSVKYLRRQGEREVHPR